MIIENNIISKIKSELIDALATANTLSLSLLSSKRS